MASGSHSKKVNTGQVTELVNIDLNGLVRLHELKIGRQTQLVNINMSSDTKYSLYK